MDRNLPKLLREAERRVNAHVWPNSPENRGADDHLASIPANRDTDTDLLLIEAAERIEALEIAQRTAEKRMDHESFQSRVANWMMETFSMETCRSTAERNHRFLEESLELVQSLGCTAAEAHMLVDYTFGRPVGEPRQEVGGVMVTLAALCTAADMSMANCSELELLRCWKNIERIRAKQATKPPSSPLPGPTIADNDCEDQGFTRISEGCFRCLPTFVEGKPVRQPLERFERNGRWYWRCPKCEGYYGDASPPNPAGDCEHAVTASHRETKS
jgi:hypothetical protein